MKKFSAVLTLIVIFIFVSCGSGGKSETPKTDNDQTDVDTVDDSDDTGRKQGELYGECYPNETCNKGLICDEENNVCIKDPGNQEKPDEDSNDIEISDQDHDNPEKPEDHDNPQEPDEDSDNIEISDEDSDTPEIPEPTENHKISGILQAGSTVSNIKAALVECGKTKEIASANTDANGKFSFQADIAQDKTYCVKANDFASCFIGWNEHIANISEITNAAYLLDQNCADLRKSETKVRAYAKLGTGTWLGELDYSKLTGISEGLKLLSSFLNTTDAKTLSEKIAADIQKTEGREFEKFFNGFRISADKKEVVIDTANTNNNEVSLNIEGGSSIVADGFKIFWTALNKTEEAATHKFKSVEPGEYTVRAKLVDDGGNPIMISEDSSTILFILEKAGGTIDVSDMSKDISHYIDHGIYVVIPKNTVIKKADGSKVNTLTYTIMMTGDGSQISKIDFGPEGTTFSGDSLYFVYELGTVFGGDPTMLSAARSNGEVLQSAGGDPIMLAAAGDPIMFSSAGDPIMQIARSAGGDPIMQSAAGDPIMTNAAGDPIMTSAAGDPIMNAAAGDPIMTSAAGDPIMNAAAGDPIMLGTSSSVMIAKTDHFSGFLLNSTSLPVSVDALVSRWCDSSYYHGYSPVAFIKKGVEDNKAEGSDKTELLSYLDCSKIGELEGDLYELINKPLGYQRNLNLFENIYYVSEFYNRMLAKNANGEVAAAKNGAELRSAIASLYTATTSLNRSSTLADLFDSSKIPLTYSGVTPEDYSSDAQKAVTGLTETSSKYVATKKEMMIFANYITTSPKGPDFSGVSQALTPDKFVCAWFTGTAENCNKVYSLNSNGRVALNGTAVSLEDAENIFAKFFMPMNSRLSESEKLDLFRTYFLTLKYIGTIFYGGDKVAALNAKLLETAYLVFDGINCNANAVSIVDTFDASANTVQVVENGDMGTLPYLSKLSDLTNLISLDVSAAADVEKVLIKTEGYTYEKVTENTRTYYKTTGELKENSIILTPGTLSTGLKPLKELIGSNDVNTLGNIAGKMTVVVNSKISGKTYSTQKTYEFLVNETAEGVETKPLPSNLLILIHDAAGNAIALENNPGIILNPGNRTFYPDEFGEIKITNLTPASYTITASADGYYARSVGVNVPENATLGVEIKLDEEITSSQSEANLTLKVNINTVKHPEKVYIQIYDEDMELVANESARFNETSNGYDDVNISINFGRYTLLTVGEEMYNYIEAITVNDENTVKEITVVAKNACGNGIIDAGEECETGDSDSTTVRCGDVFHASTNPENEAVCNRTKCVYDKAACGAPTYSNCGDGIIDPGEGCDGGTKSCSEIGSMGTSAKGTAPCADNCSDWVTADNCTKTTAECGERPANTIWNDGTGRFSQTWNGFEWLPAEKEAVYGTTRDECVFSCDKGYKWDSSTTPPQCIAAPLSLGNICTGQTDCFDNGSATAVCPAYGKLFFGQDAQYALVGYCTEKSFSQKGTNPQFIVVDNFTHYEWHKTADSAKNWADAEEYCRTSTYGGTQLYWRLPKPEELLTIVDSGRTDSPLASIFSASANTFWADEESRNSENAWRINENGTLESVAKSTENHVLCVHVNEYDAPAQSFTAAEETVTDNVSGLIWQKQHVSSKSWSEALSYCEDASTDGKFDWRLPNRNELASLIDFTKTSDAASGLSSVPAQIFWTSTSSITEATKAWTVDFADGSISETDKSTTKYVLCVRSENECIGSDCVDACSFEPCKNIKNSTGVCTATGGTFTCGCKSRFHWNNSRCELDIVLHSNCDLNSLPQHGHWNIYSSIDQTCDDEDDCDWYPSTTGQYNKVPNEKECRFVCNTQNENALWEGSYVWNGDDCVGEMQPVNCDSVNTLPANTEWHNSGMIVRQWECNELETNCHWDIGTDAAYSAEPVDNRCRYKCKENYSRKNNACVADTRENVTCTGLPENASWWNGTITQTWNGSDWEPSDTGSYSDSAVDNECVFKCKNNGYFWKDSKCVTGFGRICTGQTLCYNNEEELVACPALGEDFYGQDAQYATVVCVPQSFTLNETEEGNTVTDNNTGLIWEPSPSEETYTWDNRETHCAELNSSNYGGINTWRVPNPIEFMTIVDISNHDPATNSNFTEMPTSNTVGVWTSKEYKYHNNSNGLTYAFKFSTYYGELSSYHSGGNGNSGSLQVLCVSGDEIQPATSSDFIISSDGKTVTDTRTGLMWQKGYATDKSWQEALKYCEDLTYAGYSDWRLPNINELASLLNHETPGIPYSYFPDMPSTYNKGFHSSSASKLKYHRYVHFYYGYSSETKNVQNVRCVRSDICEEGKIWNGTECVVSPCKADSCSDVQNLACNATGEETFDCICDNSDGYFWNDSGTACVNLCDPNPCADILHSETHECIPLSPEKFTCVCDEGYFWNEYSEQCVKPCYANPCVNLQHSTGACIDTDATSLNDYKCECELGYHWNGSQCIFPECNASTTLFPCKDTSNNYIWSERYDKMDWQSAVDYCTSLNSSNYGGFSSGWHLPTISELRTLIQNCSATQTGGSCRVTDSCLNWLGYYDGCDDEACDGCSGDSSGKYSKLGKEDSYSSRRFYSSSTVSDSADNAWGVYFYKGEVTVLTKTVNYYYFRCVKSK